MADTRHDEAIQDTFGARGRLTVGDATYQIHRIDAFADRHDVARLPYSIKVILENLLRHEDGLAVKAGRRRRRPPAGVTIRSVTGSAKRPRRSRSRPSGC